MLTVADVDLFSTNIWVIWMKVTVYETWLWLLARFFPSPLMHVASNTFHFITFPISSLFNRQLKSVILK